MRFIRFAWFRPGDRPPRADGNLTIYAWIELNAPETGIVRRQVFEDRGNILVVGD